MNSHLKRFLQVLEDLFFPSICEGCGEVGTYLCDKCAKDKIEIRRRQECHVCKRKIRNEELEIKSRLVHKSCRSKTSLNGVFVIAEYSKFIESYLGDIKYEFYFAMTRDLVKIMNHALVKNADFIKIAKKSLVTFVPLHPSRERWRGFNQASKIAQLIARHWGIECDGLLERTKKTKSQVGLGRKRRLRNIKQAFEFTGDIGKIKSRNVIIVDDVMTSGGTLEECAKVCKQAGIGKVYGLVCARG